MTKTLRFSDLQDRTPAHFQVNGLDLVIIRYDDQVSVLYGRCLHRGALMADGHIEGDNLIGGFMDGIIGTIPASQHTTMKRFSISFEQRSRRIM